MAKKFPPAPTKPERICWGCDQYCAATDMRCGNGSDRTPHPAELFGEDWQDWGPTPAGGGLRETAVTEPLLPSPASDSTH